MKKNLKIATAVLKKDGQILWPLAALTALLLVLVQMLADERGGWSLLVNLLEAATMLSCALLVASLIHEDAIVSHQHDWLIRPLPGGAVLLAKVAFIALAIVAPAIVGAFIAGLLRGYPLGESLLASLDFRSDAVLVIIVSAILASMTGNVRQAAFLFVAIAVFAGIAFNAVARISNLTEDLGASGVEWVVTGSLDTLVVALCVAVCWLQYVRRKTAASYWLLVATCCAIVGLLMLPWSAFFALQKAVAKEPELATQVHAELAQGCFMSASLGVPAPQATGASAGSMPTNYRVEPGREVGPNAIAFATVVAPPDLPPQSRLLVSHVSATYMDGDRSLLQLRPAVPYLDRSRDADSLRLLRNYWLISRPEFEALSSNPNPRLQLDYSFSLLSVEHSVEFPADGHRARYEGIGYCGATHDTLKSEVLIDCFVSGEQPAQLQAQIVGQPEASARRSRVPDYVPDALDVFGGRRHFISLPAPGVDTPRVKITTYEARAHFDRQLVVPGVLGGSPADCPAP